MRQSGADGAGGSSGPLDTGAPSSAPASSPPASSPPTSSPPVWNPPSDDRADVRALRDLLGVARSLHSSLDLRRTMVAIVDNISRACGFEVAAIHLREDGHYRSVAVTGPDMVRRTLAESPIPAEAWDGWFDQAHHWGEVRFIHHDDAIVQESQQYGWRPPIAPSDDPQAWHPEDMLFVGLRNASGERVGVLSVDVPLDGRVPTTYQCELLELFALHAELAMEHAIIHDQISRASAQLEWAAVPDQLTGLSDRTAVDRRTHDLASAPGGEMAVLVVEMLVEPSLGPRDEARVGPDGGARPDETEGHQVSDLVLAAVVERLRGCVRASDILARVGGDEFAVVVYSTDAAARAAEIAGRLTTALEDPVAVEGRRWEVSARIGIATSRTPARTDQLIASADAAMSRAKQPHPGDSD